MQELQELYVVNHYICFKGQNEFQFRDKFTVSGSKKLASKDPTPKSHEFLDFAGNTHRYDFQPK